MRRSRTDNSPRAARQRPLPAWIIERVIEFDRRHADNTERESLDVNSYMTVSDAAAAWKVSSRTVRRMIADRRVEFVRVGRLIRIPIKSLDVATEEALS